MAPVSVVEVTLQDTLCATGKRLELHAAGWQVREIDVAEDLVRDYDAGLEYAEAECIERDRVFEGQQEYLVRWALAGCMQAPPAAGGSCKGAHLALLLVETVQRERPVCTGKPCSSAGHPGS